MICDPCRLAADIPSAHADLHDKCAGKTWCDCQHRTPPVSPADAFAAEFAATKEQFEEELQQHLAWLRDGKPVLS